MKLHKGTIDVQSEENKGSSFTVRLKLGKDHYSAGDLVNIDSNPVVSRHRTLEAVKDNDPEDLVDETPETIIKTDYTLLIVEDNKEIIDYIKHILESRYKLLVAGDGKEGLDKLNVTHPDLIITDVMMPVMDGIELTVKIKENFDTSHIPVIMLTAKSQIKDQIHGIESGAEAYILKPFNADYLLAVISTMLKQREILFSRIMENKALTPENIKITTKDEKFMQDVMKIIEENYADPDFNVELLVEKCCVGRTVFYNKIKGLTGSAPVEFLRNIRLKIARNLLLDSGYNVSEVGYMTGFNDIKYFSKCFKGLFGQSPSEFKNKNKI
jgi:YesN/AraC family two-component response regulator